MPRIASLIASATEIVSALGLQSDIVCRSHECDYPPSVELLPAVTEPKFDVGGSSYAIDQRIKAILSEGLSVYRVDADALKRHQPQVILTQTQCEVCAVSERDVQTALREWIGLSPAVVSLAPNALSDVWSDIRRIAAALDVAPRGEALITDLKNRISDIEHRTRDLTPGRTVACIEWIDPLMAAGNWMPELVAMAGGVNLFGRAGAHSPWMTFEQLCDADPQVILVLPCGFDIARTRQEMPALTTNPRWRSLRAVTDGQVYLLDGHQYFNRPGPRLVESLEILAEILHPDRFEFHLQKSGWERL